MMSVSSVQVFFIRLSGFLKEGLAVQCVLLFGQASANGRFCGRGLCVCVRESVCMYVCHCELG